MENLLTFGAYTDRVVSMKQIDWTVYNELKIPGSLTTGQERSMTEAEIDAINHMLLEACVCLKAADALLCAVRERKSEKS